jgi:hypothetical protein
MGDELQTFVSHAIELIQGILSIADHDWKVSEQIPSTTAGNVVGLRLASVSRNLAKFFVSKILLPTHIEGKYWISL